MPPRSQIAVMLSMVLALIGTAESHANPNKTKFKQMVVFGDSLVDTGNVFTVSANAFPPPGLLYDEGRFSNGSVWVEQLADSLTEVANDNNIERPTPFLLGGSNFAFGGTDTGPGFSVEASPNLSTQVGIYLSNLGPEQTVPDPSKTLFVLSAGSNDFLRSGQIEPLIPAASLADDVLALATHGARHFMIPNLASLGQTPASKGNSTIHPFWGLFAPVTVPISETEPPPLTSDALNLLATNFNDDLDDELDDLESTILPSLGLNQVEINRLDVAGIFTDILTSPAEFGFDNIVDPFVAGINPETLELILNGSNPDTFVFLDPVHPTAAVHDILASAAFGLLNGDDVVTLSSIPEPMTAGMLALLALPMLGRRR